MLTDFGLARAVDDASLTRTGLIAGTPQFMSPEQARGEPIDARSDLFSLGSVLYMMATGRRPFRAETTLGILRRIVETEPRPIGDVNPRDSDRGLPRSWKNCTPKIAGGSFRLGQRSRPAAGRLPGPRAAAGDRTSAACCRAAQVRRHSNTDRSPGIGSHLPSLRAIVSSPFCGGRRHRRRAGFDRMRSCCKKAAGENKRRGRENGAVTCRRRLRLKTRCGRRQRCSLRLGMMK